MRRQWHESSMNVATVIAAVATALASGQSLLEEHKQLFYTAVSALLDRAEHTVQLAQSTTSHVTHTDMHSTHYYYLLL
jgi:hypothetical protein